MKLQEFFDKAIAIGIENDPRGKDIVLKELVNNKKIYEEMNLKEKEFFDIQKILNPYSDSRVLFLKEDVNFRTALVGIDIEVSEILLAETLRTKGVPIDCVISHHPSGSAYANLHGVMGMQADILNKFGVPINIAEGTLESRIREVERKIMPINHTRAMDAAKLLNIPLICLHTPADNMVSTYLQKMLDNKKPDTLNDIVSLLLEIPEYKDAVKNNSGPKILIGSKNRKCGKIFVDMTGGTGGSKEIFKTLSSSGISTIVAMHLGEDHRQEAEKHFVNVVIAGHIASDTLGLNLLFDSVIENEKVVILECSGFKRIER